MTSAGISAALSADDVGARVGLRLLGAVELAVDGRPVRLGGRMPTLLLVILALRANELVARAELVAGLWGSCPPRSAEHALRVHESRLRGALRPHGAEGLLTASRGGLTLALPRSAIDADRFEDALSAGRRALAGGDHETASRVLGDALREWRGQPAADVDPDSWVSGELARLCELRDEAFAARNEAELALGRHAELLGELRTLVLRNPLAERYRAQLMLALYRCGRQAEALELYREGRAQLVSELGIEPSDELTELERRILRHDPTLHVSPPRAADALPVTRYARSGDVSIAYQVTGEGPFDVVYLPPFVTNVELVWQVDAWASLLRRLSEGCRLIRFDRRGIGMSDRVDLGTLEDHVADLLHVMDAARSRSAALIGASGGGALGLLAAADHPDRIWALALWGVLLRTEWTPDYPVGATPEDLAEAVEDDVRLWTVPGHAEEWAAAVGAADPEALGWLVRQSASPMAIRGFDRLEIGIDVRDVASRVHVPTLVLNRAGDADASLAARDLIERIPGARHVELPGDQHVMFSAEGYEDVVAELQRFFRETHEQLVSAS